MGDGDHWDLMGSWDTKTYIMINVNVMNMYQPLEIITDGITVNGIIVMNACSCWLMIDNGCYYLGKLQGPKPATEPWNDDE